MLKRKIDSEESIPIRRARQNAISVDEYKTFARGFVALICGQQGTTPVRHEFEKVVANPNSAYDTIEVKLIVDVRNESDNKVIELSIFARSSRTRFLWQQLTPSQQLTRATHSECLQLVDAMLRQLQ